MDAGQAAGAVYNRLTTGDYIPLTPTRQRFTRKGLTIALALPGFLAVLLVVNEMPRVTQAVFSAALIPLVLAMYVIVARALFRKGSAPRKGAHVARRVTAIGGRKMQSHGWPTWRDAWGIKGMRPGGVLRAVCRGYLRVWLAFMVLGGLVAAFSGGDAFAGFLIMALLTGFFALPAAAALYLLRVMDFDTAKGSFLAVVYWFAIDLLPFGRPVNLSKVAGGYIPRPKGSTWQG